uniref:Uncharacterized protein n=1 Tax=Arundo donax TaxID=35708 RepID=A0A0A8YLC3_ARUDO
MRHVLRNSSWAQWVMYSDLYGTLKYMQSDFS